MKHSLPVFFAKDLEEWVYEERMNIVEEKKVNSREEYPNQILSFGRKNLIFAVDCHLYKPAATDSPLQMHAGYSRLAISLIDKTKGDTFVVTGNIPASDIAYMVHKIKAIEDDYMFNRKKMLAAKAKLGTDDVTLAFSETFKMGNLKGKAPGEVITEDKGVETVKAQVGFLKTNLEKYPANQRIIDACEAAIRAFGEGKIKPGMTGGVSLVRFAYQTPLKYLASKKDEATGKYFAYKISISCDYEKDTNPWTISIINGYAEVTPQADKTVRINPMLENQKQSVINLTSEEAFAFADRCSKTLSEFETCNFRELHKIVDGIREENRKKYGSSN